MQAQKTQTNKQQKGFTLVEFGITMILVSVILAIGIAGYRKYSRNIQVNDNITLLTVIAESARGKYGTTQGYANVTTASAVSSGIIPVELQDTLNGTTASNKFNSAVTLLPGANNTAVLTWGNVPRAVCANIATGVEGAFVRIQVNGTDVKPLGGVLDDGTLTTQCANDANTFALFIGKA